MIFRKIRGAFRRVRRSGRFSAELRAFEQMARESVQRFEFSRADLYPRMTDATATTGFDRHYVFHPAWAARILAQTRPDVHVDIASTLYFCTLVSAFVPVKFYDYRPANLDLENLSSESANLLALPFPTNSVKSLSCMHTIEHIGMGRYGDELDYNGDLKAMVELERVLAPGGNLLFVVPVGRPRIIFNAHRIYSYDQIAHSFANLTLKEFALIPDDEREGGLIRNASSAQANAQSYGCGCFWFQKAGAG